MSWGVVTNKKQRWANSSKSGKKFGCAYSFVTPVWRASPHTYVIFLSSLQVGGSWGPGNWCLVRLITGQVTGHDYLQELNLCYGHLCSASTSKVKPLTPREERESPSNSQSISCRERVNTQETEQKYSNPSVGHSTHLGGGLRRSVRPASWYGSEKSDPEKL